MNKWHQLHCGNPLSARYLNDEALEPHEVEQLNTLVDTWRERLSSISWYMRVLNEKVARMTNIEDDVTGRFWEGRFKCQALLDEQALLSCMAYVDLNPVRASMAQTPEASAHTSVKRRTDHLCEITQNNNTFKISPHSAQPCNLHLFTGNLQNDMPRGIMFNLLDYLELVDWTERQIRADKVGSIDAQTAPILTRLSITPEHWIYLCTHFESQFKGLVGSVHSLKAACEKLNRRRRTNLSPSRLLFE